MKNIEKISHSHLEQLVLQKTSGVLWLWWKNLFLKWNNQAYLLEQNAIQRVS